jgi:glutaredoxin
MIALVLCARSSQRRLLPGMMQRRNETMSAHPEDARLAASGPREVTLYTRPGCHLCDEAKSAIALLLHEFSAEFREVNVDADPVLKERYGWDIPVLFIGQRKAAKHRVDVGQFRRQLQDAAAS